MINSFKLQGREMGNECKEHFKIPAINNQIYLKYARANTDYECAVCCNVLLNYVEFFITVTFTLRVASKS